MTQLDIDNTAYNVTSAWGGNTECAVQKEAALVHLNIRLVKDKKLSRTQRKGSRIAQEKIFELWTQYETGQKTARELLSACSHYWPEPARHFVGNLKSTSGIMSGGQQKSQTGDTGADTTPMQHPQTDWRSIADAAASISNPMYASRPVGISRMISQTVVSFLFINTRPNCMLKFETPSRALLWLNEAKAAKLYAAGLQSRLEGQDGARHRQEAVGPSPFRVLLETRTRQD
uniref:Uncharacterized protein n=1 Tax=Branchiostoma floridae TaxID=7739 RepID=C3YND2_BRAFL|eukprot:XP_002602226.1 hypothetical protein BRAFLDRAFT_76914 [Branchiostoma floridae]